MGAGPSPQAPVSDHTIQPWDKDGGLGRPLWRPTAEEAPRELIPRAPWRCGVSSQKLEGYHHVPQSIKGIEDTLIVKSAFKLLVRIKGIMFPKGLFAGSKTLGYNQARRRGSKKSAMSCLPGNRERRQGREARALSS